MTSIHLRAQLLLDVAPDKKWQKGLQEILDQSFRCQITLRGLVSYASTTASQMINIELADLLRHCLTVTRPPSRSEKRCNVELNMPEHMPSVKGDPLQLEHVVVGLLDTATALAKENATVSVTAKPTEDAVQIGIHSPTPDCSDNAEPPQTSGGFALCKALIRDHGGVLEEPYRDRDGWTWTIELPTG